MMTFWGSEDSSVLYVLYENLSNTMFEDKTIPLILCGSLYFGGRVGSFLFHLAISRYIFKYP